jgi:hypothetical protein
VFRAGLSLRLPFPPTHCVLEETDHG